MDAARRDAWNVLRLIAEWEGEGIPGHEEGLRIVSAARGRGPSPAGNFFGDAMAVIDPTGKSFPVAITAAWEARKANA